MSARILLVEDDPVSQDLLRSVLQARGYGVDAASDGFTGLRMLKRQAYDLALVDYHLPELDGYASARLMREVAHGGPVLKLVAITADRHGLMARSGAEAVFDAILTKPIEPQPLFRFIETLLDASGEHASAQAAAKAFLRDPRHEQARAAAEAFWRDCGLSGRPKAIAAPQPTPEQALALSFCFDAGEPGTADLIVLLDRDGLDQLPALHERLPGRPTLVVDVTGHALEACDAGFRVDDPSSWSEVAGLLQRFKARSARLTPAARAATDPDARLLACLYVADRALRLAHDPSRRLPIRQGGWFAESEAMLAAERLTARGLLSRQVIERPPNGIEFVYVLADAALAGLTASGPGLDLSDGSGPDAVRATLERAIRAASKTFADASGAATRAKPDPTSASGSADPIATLRRLFVQSARDLVAQADDQGKPTASAGSEADVPRRRSSTRPDASESRKHASRR